MMSAYGQIVIIKRTGEDGSCFPVLTKTCKIGRGNVCDIRVQRDGVSDEQCIIETRTDAQVWIRNLTHNQTLLNGVPISNEGAALKHKDIFVVSDRAFRWEYMPGSKFYCVIKDDSTETVKAPSEIISKDEKDKMQTDAMKQVESPALRTPNRKSNRRSILETVPNVRGWSVFDMSDRSEKLQDARNVLHSPVKTSNNSTYDLIDFEDSVRSYLGEEIEHSGQKQNRSTSILKRSLRKSNDRWGSATPNLLKSAKKQDKSSSKMDNNRHKPKKLVTRDYANSSLCSVEKVNLEVSDFTVDSCETLKDSAFTTKESGSFVVSTTVEENLISHVTMGRTRGRRFSSDNVPFVTPALLKRQSIKREYQFSNSIGSIIDSVKGKSIKAENSENCDSRSAATDESSFVSSILSETTGWGDESTNENHSLITSEEESEESMSRAFVNVRTSRRCRNIPKNSSPFVTPAILKSMKRNVRKSSVVSGLSLSEQKLSLNGFDEVEHNVSSPKSQCKTTRSVVEFPEDLSQTLNKDVMNNEECINNKESDAAKQMDESPVKISVQSSYMAQEVKSEGDNSLRVHSLLQGKACDSPASVKLKSRKTSRKKYMGQEEDKQLKSSRKTRQHNADSQDEFVLVMNGSERMDEVGQVLSEGGVDSILSNSVASTANATIGTLHSVASESFVSTFLSSSSSEKLDSAKVCPDESKEAVSNVSFDGSVECYETDSKKEKIMKRNSGIAPQSNVSVSKDEIAENDKENLDESPLEHSSEEMVGMSVVKSTESNLLSQRSPRRSLRKSLQNIPNQEIADSVLENQKQMTPVGNIPDISVKDESVKSKHKIKKSIFEQENVPIITDEKEEFGIDLEKSIEEDRMDLSISNILEASTASSVKSITKTPRARKSLGDLSLIETNAVKSNRKSPRYSKSRNLNDSKATVFIQEGGISHSKTPIADNNEKAAKIKSARSIRRTRQAEIAPGGSFSIIGNCAGIVKVEDGLESSDFYNKESSVICDLSMSKKSSRRTPGKIKLERRISNLASMSNQEEIDSCFEGLMGDLRKTPASKITSEGRKSLKKGKKSGIKSKNVSFSLDNTSTSIKNTDDKMASSLIEDECEESLINPLDSSLTSFGKLRSSSGKCKGMYTFSSTPISNQSRKLNLSMNPDSDLVQKAVHSPIAEEEAADIELSHKIRSINFGDLEESSATIHEVSESNKEPHYVESSAPSNGEISTSSKSLFSAVSSITSNKTTPSSRKTKTGHSQLASSLGFSIHLNESSYYEDAISDSVKIPSPVGNKEHGETKEESFSVLSVKDNLIYNEIITGNCDEISSTLEEDTTVVEPNILQQSIEISSAKRTSNLVQLEEDEQTAVKMEELIGDKETIKGKTKKEILKSPSSCTPSSVKPPKILPRKKKDDMNESQCLEGVSNLLKTPVVETTRSLRKLRRSALEKGKEASTIPEKIEEFISCNETNTATSEEVSQKSVPDAPTSEKTAQKMLKKKKEEMNISYCLQGVDDPLKTPERETNKSHQRLRSSVIEGVMENSVTGEKVEELMSDNEMVIGPAEAGNQESSITCTSTSGKSAKRMSRHRREEMNGSHCLEGVSVQLKTPATENTKSLRKLTRSVSERVVEDSTTVRNIEKLTNCNEADLDPAKEMSEVFSVSGDSSSVMSSKKLHSCKKNEMDVSHCLEGVSDLLKTPAVENTKSLRKNRRSMEGVKEDSLIGEKLEESMSGNETDSGAAEVISPVISESGDSSSVMPVQILYSQDKDGLDESQSMEGVSDLLKTPALKTTRSLRKLRRSVVEGASEDSASGAKVEVLMSGNETVFGPAEEMSQESSITCTPSSVKSLNRMSRRNREEMNVSHCLDGVSKLLKTPAVENTKSLRKNRRSMEGVKEDSLIGEKLEELTSGNETDSVAVEVISPVISESGDSSSVMSVKKLYGQDKDGLDESQSMEGVSDLLKTPALKTTRSLRKLRRSVAEGATEDSASGAKVEVLMSGNETVFGPAEEMSQESSITCTPSSVKSLNRMSRRNREEMNVSHCLDGVSKLLKTPAVENTKSLRKNRRSMEGVKEDSLIGEKLEELTSGNETDSVAVEVISPVISESGDSSSVMSVKKLYGQDKDGLDESQSMEGVSDLLKTPALKTTRSLRKLRRSVVEGASEDSASGAKVEVLMSGNETVFGPAEEMSQESSITCTPSSVKSLNRMSRRNREEMNVSHCLDGVSKLLKTPAVENTKSLRKNRRSMEGVKEDSLIGEKLEELTSGNETDSGAAEVISPVISESGDSSSVMSVKKLYGQDKDGLDESQSMEGVSDLLKTPALKTTRSLRKLRRSIYLCINENVEESFADGDNQPENKDVQEYSIYSPSSWAPCSVKSILKTPNLRNIENDQINDSLCLEGIGNLFGTPAVKVTKSLCNVRKSEVNAKMKDMICDDSVAELQDDEKIGDIERDCQDSPVNSVSTLSRSLIKFSKKFANQDCVVIEPIVGTNLPEGATEMCIQEVRSDNDFNAVKEMDDDSVINRLSLSILSSVKSTKKTPKHIIIEKDHMNDSHCLEGGAMETPTVNSSKNFRRLKQYGFVSKGKDFDLEESSADVSINIGDDGDLAEEIRNESLIVHPPSSAQNSVKSSRSRSKQRRGGKEKLNDSICLEGVSRLMETPATKSASFLRKSKRFEVNSKVEDSPTEGTIKELVNISERCLGNANKANISRIKEVGGISLLQSPRNVLCSSQQLRKNIGQNIGGSGSPSFSSTPLVKRPNKSLNLSSNFEDVGMMKSKDDVITYKGVSTSNSRKSERYSGNVDSSLVKSSELDIVVHEAKRKTPNSKKSWHVSDLTPSSSQNSINVTNDTSALETEYSVKMKEHLAVGEGGNAMSKTSLSMRSTRRKMSQLEDSSLLSDSCTVTNEKAHNEGNVSSVLGDMDCSWVTSSTFSFVRTPESSKRNSLKKSRKSEIGTNVSMGVGDAPLINVKENPGIEGLDVVDEKQGSPKTACEKSCQSYDVKVPQPVSSYEDVSGVKEVMTHRSPLSRYSSFLGVKELFAPKSPTCSYENVSGVKELMSRKSPKSRYSDVQGLRKLFNQRSPVCDYGNVSGIQDLFNVSSESNNKQMAAVNTGSELSHKSMEENKGYLKLKSAVVLIQKLDAKVIDHDLKKDNLGVRNSKSRKVCRGSDEEGADESLSSKPDISAELLQSTTENQENPVRLSDNKKISKLLKSSESDTVSEESKLGLAVRRGRLQKSKEKDLTEELSRRSTRALRRNKSTSLSVSEESEPLPERTKPSISNSVDEEFHSGQTSRRGRVLKSKSKEKDVNLEGAEDSSSSSRRALRRNRSTSDTVCEDSKIMESNESNVQKSKSKEKYKEVEGTVVSSSTGKRALRKGRSISLTMSEESEPLPKTKNITSSIIDTVDEECEVKEANTSVKMKKSKEKDQELARTLDSSRSERRPTRGNRSNSLTLSKESEPVLKAPKLSSLISDTVDDISKTKEANRRGRVKKSKSNEKDQELEGTVDSSSTGRRVLRRNRSTSLTTETDDEKQSKREEAFCLDSCAKSHNTLSKKMKSVRFDPDVKQSVDSKALTPDLDSDDKSHSLRQKRPKSSGVSEENEPLSKRTKPSTLNSDAVSKESKSSQRSVRGIPQKSKSKEENLNLQPTEDLLRTSRRSIRGNKSFGKIIETDTKVKEMEITDVGSKDKVRNLRQNKTASASLSEESEPLPKTTKGSLISVAVIEEGKLGKTNRRGRPQKSKSKDNELNLEGIEDSSNTSRRTLRGNKSTCVTIETDAKKRVGKKAEVSTLDRCNDSGNLGSKRAKSLSASEENGPPSKRTRHESSVSESIDMESKSSQASERGRGQKSKSKEKDVNLERTEDPCSRSRRTLRGNKSTSSAAVSEGVRKKNASKINKNTSSPKIVSSKKDNGKTTDAKEDISKIQVQKSKPLKMDLSVNEVKRITRKTSVDKGKDSKEMSRKKEIPLKNQGKVEEGLRRVTRGAKKAVYVTIETDAKKRVGKKAEVSTLDRCNDSGNLGSKRAKSLSASEENGPPSKRTRHESSVSESIDMESKSSQASERGRGQKSKSKEKDVNLERTEDPCSRSRRTLRGNKSTSSAAVSEGVRKKNASKINKNTSSPKIVSSKKDNGKTTDAKEDISKIQVQKSKPLKMDLSVNEVKRITRKTSVDKGKDSKEMSRKKEIPLKNQGKVEEGLRRVTRGAKKAV